MRIEGPTLPSDAPGDHARFEFDDGPYLLGALDDDQREAFEHHLMSCPLCQDRLAELSELPAILARADLSAWEPESPPDTLLPRLLRQVRASRRRQAWRTATLTLAAACLVVVLAAGAVTGWRHANQTRTLAMQAVGANAAVVHATVQLTRSGAQTRIKLDCGYYAASTSYPAAGASYYRMVVFNRAGEQRDLGEWTPQPGEDVQIARTSPWPRQALSRIEVSNARGETVLRLSL